MDDLKTTKETFDAKEIENSITAIQKLQEVLDSYQESLSNSSTSQISWLDNIKNIVVVMGTLQTVTNKFKNVGRGKMFPLSLLLF